nr:phosphoglucomutase [Desulfobulbaceae bacterium]
MISPHKASESLTENFITNSSSTITYFDQIQELVKLRNQQPAKSQSYSLYQEHINTVYGRVRKKILSNTNPPSTSIKFGTSGWRGIIGDDIYCHSVGIVTQAIINMYQSIGNNAQLDSELNVASFEETQRRGCVLGFDNRFGNEMLAIRIIDVLTSNGIKVYYAGESSTGLLSASVLQRQAAFSINLTPSHNPLQYAGFKFNGADAGPASPVLTEEITRRANLLISSNTTESFSRNNSLICPIKSLQDWVDLTTSGEQKHGLNYKAIINDFINNDAICVVIDCVHGASRVDIASFFNSFSSDRLQFLRTREDTTFGGIAPEPSTTNMIPVVEALSTMRGPLKLGVIMDPDADRIRFTDGTTEINMNYFGAMAYHYLHEKKHKNGMVAKTVATSNFANAIAEQLNETVFEPKVGFKEFKPVIDKALVCFEESDGITIIGHTPEKDAYIGLLLALDMTITLQMNLGDYLKTIQQEYGEFYPDKDGVEVSEKGDTLINTLSGLSKYTKGSVIKVGEKDLAIKQVIDIDGFKFVFEDQSWLMIRPSGTEPKVRFYVEARNERQKEDLFAVAKKILSDLGLV